MKQAKKNKERRLSLIQARELVYRFQHYSDNIHKLVLTKEMTREERKLAFYMALRT